MSGYTDQEIEEGRALMAAKLTALRETIEAGQDVARLESVSPVGRGLTGCVRIENLDALVIYSRGPLAWYADLIMKDLPAGISNVIGTPVHRPCSCRQEAEEAGDAMLEGILSVAIRNGSRPRTAPDTIPFSLFGIEVLVPAEMVADSLALRSNPPPGLDLNRKDYEGIMGMLCRDIFGENEPDVAFLDAAPDHLKVIFNRVVCGLLSFGSCKYPAVDVPGHEVVVEVDNGPLH